jgi:hypothetical protein
MKITIGNVDYTSALDAARPLTIVRKLNEPSTCRLYVTLPASSGFSGSGLSIPVRNQSLAITGDSGIVYFTGYLALNPLPEYAGLGLAGPVYRIALEAVSDELLLDTQMLAPISAAAGLAAGALLQTLVTRTGLTSGAGSLNTAGLTLATSVGHFKAQPGAKWSQAAGMASSQAHAAYRVVSGALALSPLGASVHTLDESAGTLELANLQLTASLERALANDVTVCGAEEPVAYVTEYFHGDGVATLFPLSAIPFFGPAASEKVIYELFNEPAIDLRYWTFTGHDGYNTISGGGMTMNGGTGTDGQAGLVWIDPVEAGGTLVLECSGINLSAGSTGVLAGLYNGAVLAANCVAGFAVTAAIGTGAVSVAPLIQGVVAGPSFALDPALEYTLRVRLHCPEVERVTSGYRVTGDAGLVEFGGGGVVASSWAELEIQQFLSGVGGVPVVLYDGAVGFTPAVYSASPANSLNLIGTMRAVFLSSLGSGWVRSTPVGGGAYTRRQGTLAQGAECHLERTGFVSFYTGYAPTLGETVAVSYRTEGRAVGRAINAASQSALASAGLPATAVWIGSVTAPAARSSLDCRNAAEALVTAASSVSAAWSGAYRTTNFGLTGDLWPGDALGITAPSILVNGTSLATQVFIREVTLYYRAAVPDVVQYQIAFGNDWADDLSIKTSRAVPADAWLPAAVLPAYLQNLSGLTVTAISASAVTVATNVTAPAGGGFEVRRRDFAFQPGQDADLVIRSNVSNFDIPRAAEAERFYIRMYDASAPPNYSEFSAALFVNLPLAAAPV